MAATKPPGGKVKTVAPLLLKAPKGEASKGADVKADAAKSGGVKRAAQAGASAMTGNQYRDLIASYIHHNYASEGLVVYVEIALGKTVIGKDRCIDVFVVRPDDRKAIAIECKYQDSLGTVDEKIPYALQDLDALWVPGCLVYAGRGWSKGVLHSLEASRLAAYCLPDQETLHRSKQTRELDHMLAAIFGFWDLVLPASKRYRPPSAST
jgi:hypothetical protein